MPVFASNIILVPPPPAPEVIERVSVSGTNWRDELIKMNPPPVVHVKKERPVEKLIQHRESSFMNDMLSINKE